MSEELWAQSFDEFIDQYRELSKQSNGVYRTCELKYTHSTQYTHVVIMLDLSATLWEYELGDFKFNLMISAIQRLFTKLTDQLCSIFIMGQSESLRIFSRNHKLDKSNLQLVCDCLVQHIKKCYNNKKPPQEYKLTIQRALQRALQYLRSRDKRYEHKKFIIFSDFISFGYDSFSCLFQFENEAQQAQFWDSYGYTISVNGVLLGSKILNPYTNFGSTIEFRFMNTYMRILNGYLYDLELKNDKDVLININQTTFTYNQKPIPVGEIEDKVLEFEQLRDNHKQVENCMYFRIGEYPIQMRNELIQMRLKEGYYFTSRIPSMYRDGVTLKIALNMNIWLLYILCQNKCVLLIQTTGQFFWITSSVRQKEDIRRDLNNLAMYLGVIKDSLQSRDEQQMAYLNIQMNTLDQSFEQFIKLRAFEDQSFVSRNFVKISLFYVIRYIDFKKFQEEGEKVKVQSIYNYIRDKIRQIANKSIGNFLLYIDDSNAFIILQLVWHSHSICRLICIYQQNDQLFQKIESKVKEIIRSDSILSQSLIPFDHKLKDLLVASADYGLSCDEDWHHLELKWDWDHSYIWKVEEMFKICASMRVRLGFAQIPSNNSFFNKYYIQQYFYNDQPIIIVQRLILDQDKKKIYIHAFTENLLTVMQDGTPIRNILLSYFEQMKEQEFMIIKKLYTVHLMYKYSLSKKLNETIKLDYFVMNYLDIHPNKQKDKEFYQQSGQNLVRSFKERAQSELKLYPDCKDPKMVDLDSLLKHAYFYQQINQQYIKDGSQSSHNKQLHHNYLEIVQTHSNYSASQNGQFEIKTNKYNGYMNFILIGCKKLFMISLESGATKFYLLCLDYIEKNLNVPQFLNQHQQTVLNGLISYIDNQYKQSFARILNQLCHNMIYLDQILISLDGCQNRVQEVELTDLLGVVRQYFDSSGKSQQTSKSTVSRTTQITRVSSFVEESPSKPIIISARSTLVKSSSLINLKQQIFNEILCRADQQFQIDLNNNVRKIPNQDLYFSLKLEDKQVRKLDSDVTILYLRLTVKRDQDSERSFEQFSQLIFNQDSPIMKTTKSIKQWLRLTYYYFESKSIKIIQGEPISPYIPEGSALTSQLSSQLIKADSKVQSADLKTFRLNRWTELFRNQIAQLALHTILDIKRFESFTDDSFRQLNDYLDKFIQKQIKVLVTKPIIQDGKFTVFFNRELINQSDEHTLFNFIYNEDFYIFVMNQQNYKHILFDQYKLEKEFLVASEDQYVIPFWLVMRINNSSIEALWIHDKGSKFMEQIVDELQIYITELVDRANLQILIEDAAQYQNTSYLKLTPKFRDSSELEQEQQLQDQLKQHQKSEDQGKNVIWPFKRQGGTKKTTLSSKKQIKQQEVPFVGFKLYEMYDKSISAKLVKNTIFNNNKCMHSKNTYFGFHNKQVYILIFQEIKNMAQMVKLYSELDCEEYRSRKDASYWIIINCYSAQSNAKQNQDALDHFYNHIVESQEWQIVEYIHQQFKTGGVKLKIQDYNYIYNNEVANLELTIHPDIQDLYVYLQYVKQNVEKVFIKYDLSQKNQFERSISDIDDQITEISEGYQINYVDQQDNAYIYTHLKYINSTADLKSIFGDGIALLFLEILNNHRRISSFVLRKGQKFIQQDQNLDDIKFLPQDIKQSNYTLSREEASYDFNKRDSISGYQLQIQIHKRGYLKFNFLQNYLQSLVSQVELEYFVECVLSSNNSTIITQINQINQLFGKLKNYSFHMHHYQYALKYEYITWPSVLKWMQDRVLGEFLRKLGQESMSAYQSIVMLSNGESHSYEQASDIKINQDDLNDKQLCYLVSDQIKLNQTEQNISQSIERAKQIVQKKAKNDLEYQAPRSLLFMIIISSGHMELFSYNTNWEILYNLNQQLQILSKWSIARDRVAQKMKNELCGAHNILITETIEQTHRRNHVIYDTNNQINEINRLFIWVPKTQLGDSTKSNTMFNNSTKAITYIVQHLVPQGDEKIVEIQSHVDQFNRILLPQVKPRKILQPLKQQGDFLEREGLNFLAYIKDEFLNQFFRSLQVYIYHLDRNQKQFPHRLIKESIDRLLSRAHLLYVNKLPLYLIRNRNEPIRNLSGGSLYSLGTLEKSEIDKQKSNQKIYYTQVQEAIVTLIQNAIDQGYESLVNEQRDNRQNQSSYADLQQAMDFQLSCQTVKVGPFVESKRFLNKQRLFSGGQLDDLYKFESQNFKVQEIEQMYDQETLQELVEQEEYGMLAINQVLIILRKTMPNKLMLIKQIIFDPPLIIEKLYSIPQSEGIAAELAQQEDMIRVMERIHMQSILKNKDNQDSVGCINLLILLKKYCQFYQSHNISLPKVVNYILKVNIGLLFQGVKVKDFAEFIVDKNNRQLYFLKPLAATNSKLCRVTNQLITQQVLNEQSLSLFIEFMSELPQDSGISELEMSLNRNHEGIDYLYLVMYAVIEQNIESVELLKEELSNQVLIVLQRAYKNFLAYLSWHKIKSQSVMYFSQQDLRLMTEYCIQIQIKKLPKEAKFLILEDSYYSMQFAVQKFPQFIQDRNLNLKVSDCSKTILIPDEMEQVFYVIELNEQGTLAYIRILYLYADSPYYDLEQTVQTHFNICTQIVKEFISLNSNNSKSEII